MSKKHTWQASASGTGAGKLEIPAWLLPILEKLIIDIILKIFEEIRSQTAKQAQRHALSGKEQAAVALNDIQYTLRTTMAGLFHTHPLIRG